MFRTNIRKLLHSVFIFGGSAERKYIFRCLAYFSRDYQAIVLLFVFMTLSMLTGILQAWPLAVMIDALVAPGAPPDWTHRLFTGWLPQTPLAQVVGLAAISLGLKLAQEGFGIGRKLLHWRINYNGVLGMRCDLFRKLQAMHLGYHRSRPLGDTIFRLSTDTQGCQTVLGVLLSVGFAVITIAVILGVLVSRSPALTGIALLVVPPMICANIYFGRKFKAKTDEAKAADSAYVSSIHRAVAAISLTQAFGREEDEFSRFGSAARRCINAWVGINKEEIGYGLAIGATLGVGGALILGYGGYLVYRQSLSPGELMVFMSYLGMMYDPLCQLTGAGINLQSGLASAKRVFEVLDKDVKVADAPGALRLPLKPRALKIENVSFHYAAGKAVLDGISVAVPPGASVGFVGPSGVGKSTLLNLLPRFYDPSAGHIALDGHDIKKVRLKDLRRHIALALQDSIILPTTIRENIAYGRPSATLRQIKEAARLAGADRFIAQLPRGYDTELAEGGQNLSGGQKQRLAVARALLTEAPILVLDEPTSSQDAHHEEHLTDTLRMLKGRRTMIVVSHRITTIQHCDIICLLDGGKIAEMGAHDELMQKRGLYYRLAASGGGFLTAAA